MQESAAMEKLNRKSRPFICWPLYISLLLLFFNDIYWKGIYSNWVTGKLSDFAGVFTVLLIGFFWYPRNKRLVALFAFFLFLIWKSSLSQPAIDFVNLNGIYRVDRVIDYSDLISFLVLPLVIYIHRNESKYLLQTKLFRIPAILLLVVSVAGTSLAAPYHEYVVKKSDVAEKIDAGIARQIIESTIGKYGLLCQECGINNNQGLYSGNRMRLEYFISDDFSRIEFRVRGRPSGSSIGIYAWPDYKEIDELKSKLLSALKSEFGDMVTFESED